MKYNTERNRNAVIVGVLLAFAFVLRMIYEDLDDAFLQTLLLTIRNAIHIILLVLWVLSLHRRLVNKNVRYLMVTVGCLLIFWLIDKIIK